MRRGLGRGAGSLLRLATLLVLACATLAGAWAAASAASPWTTVTPPWSGVVRDLGVAGPAGLIAAGDGHIAVSTDAAGTWRVVVPPGHEATAFTAAAMNAAGQGVVASGGVLLVTPDWGATWATPTILGGTGTSFTAVAIRGSQALAVGEDGSILASDDGGSTWQGQSSPATGGITAVAIAGDGTAVAGTATGQVLVRSGETWTVAATITGAITSVAASDAPVWGDGRPDLLATTGSDVLGSDDGTSFSSLPGLPDLTAFFWPAMSFVDLPAGTVLLASSGTAGLFVPEAQSWTTSPTELGAVERAAGVEGQSVAYLLAANGTIARTLSAGGEPATMRAGVSRLTVGGKTRISATVSVGASGAVRLEGRVAGGTWQLVDSRAWTAADLGAGLSIPVAPSLTTEYRLQFVYGGSTTLLASGTRVTVIPRVFTDRRVYRLRKGDVYRFSGSVAPNLPGERVVLYTDRGGRWRPVSQQGSIRLKAGVTWKSRAFGTPKAERYHLRARLKATTAHAGAWSRIVTVVIR